MTPSRNLAIALIATSLMSCAVETPKNTPAAFTVPDYATAPLDLSTPQATAYSLMMAMYRGDVEMIDQVFTEAGTLQRVKADGTVMANGLPRWRDWVGTLEMGQAHEEIFALKVEKFENIATVWAPFVISLDGKIVGCGVNQLSMARTNAEWRIVSGMDTPAPKEDCPTFKADTLASHN